MLLELSVAADVVHTSACDCRGGPRSVRDVGASRSSSCVLHASRSNDVSFTSSKCATIIWDVQRPCSFSHRVSIAFRMAKGDSCLW